MTHQDQAPRSADLVDLQDQERTLEILSQSVLGLWDVVNNLTRLRPTRRDQYRVTLFGSARVQPDHWAYAAVRDLAAELSGLGCTIVTGGGPGLMQAANEGASAGANGGKGRSMGIRVGAMWSELIDWHRRAMLRPDAPLASEEDMAIPVCVPGAKEAIEILRAHHAAWTRLVPA